MVAMTLHTRKNRRAGVLAAVMAGVLLAVPACASDPEAGPSPSPSTPAETPDPYTGPLTFVGDELDAFALTPEEIATLLPGAPPAGALTDELVQYSDGGGPTFDPAVCVLFLTETSMRSVGARTVPMVDAQDTANSGRQEILQFGSVEVAAERMDQLLSTVDACAQFDAQGPGSFVSATAPESEGVRAFAGTFELTSSGTTWRAHHAFAAVGNVIVHLSQPSAGDEEFDAEGAATLLRDRAVEAKEALVAELTAHPPVTETPTPADASAPWSEWEITTTGVGPLVFGTDRETVIAAVPGATLQEDDWSTTHARLISADGASSVVLHWTEDSGTLMAVTVGIANMQGDTEPDGAALPAAGDVRIGAPLADVVVAFPEGTRLHVVSSGEYFYEWAARDGGVLRFRLDRDFADPAAVVTGVTAEDAKLTPPLAVE